MLSEIEGVKYGYQIGKIDAKTRIEATQTKWKFWQHNHIL